MLDNQYSGVILEDKWGNTYLCSSSLLAYSDLGQDYLWRVQDSIYGSYFLHDLEPHWDLRQIWAEMYQHARPWEHNLTKYTDFQLRDSLLSMFAEREMWIWQLTEGWSKPPTDNGIGDGGLAPASRGGAGPAPVAKTAKPKGGGAITEAPVAAKSASYEAKGPQAAAAKPQKIVDMPNDLVEDAAGVYGYMPTTESQFHSSKWPVDWSNPAQVDKARTVRLEYHEGLDKKRQLINNLKKDGVSDQQIAQMIVDSRNKDRLSHYKTPESLAAVHQRNLDKYGDINGPTYDSQLEKYGSDNEIIEAALRSNDTMDILTGISKPRGKK
jgi:hypothetical protein